MWYPKVRQCGLTRIMEVDGKQGYGSIDGWRYGLEERGLRFGLLVGKRSHHVLQEVQDSLDVRLN